MVSVRSGWVDAWAPRSGTGCRYGLVL